VYEHVYEYGLPAIINRSCFAATLQESVHNRTKQVNVKSIFTCPPAWLQKSVWGLPRIVPLLRIR
jgi:hypothetical protein